MIDDVVRHYEETLGEPAREGRFKPRGRDEVVWVYKWPAESIGRDVTIYGTAGACAAAAPPGRSRTEFLVTLYPERDEIASPLAELAHFPIQERTRLGSGHTLMLADPLWPGTEMNGFLVVEPGQPLVPGLTTGGGEEVEFLVAIPIFESELAFKKAHGVDALVRRWHEDDVHFDDPRRGPVRT